MSSKPWTSASSAPVSSLQKAKYSSSDRAQLVQLRRDNAAGTLYNLVGFQTHLKWGEQKRVFSLIRQS